jgi:hypothetical protein
MIEILAFPTLIQERGAILVSIFAGVSGTTVGTLSRAEWKSLHCYRRPEDVR